MEGDRKGQNDRDSPKQNNVAKRCSAFARIQSLRSNPNVSRRQVIAQQVFVFWQVDSDKVRGQEFALADDTSTSQLDTIVAVSQTKACCSFCKGLCIRTRSSQLSRQDCNLNNCLNTDFSHGNCSESTGFETKTYGEITCCLETVWSIRRN
jgi:hypothetical protein